MILHTKLYKVQSLYVLIFEKVDGYSIKYDETKYLILIHFDRKYERISLRIRHIIKIKNNVPDVYFHKCTKIKINLDDYLPLEKT